MARRNRRAAEPSAPPVFGGHERRESWGEAIFVVRSISGAAATKPYRCPGCAQEIRAGVAHVVVWPSASTDASGRRHWHTSCWAARARRGPTSF